MKGLFKYLLFFLFLICIQEVNAQWRFVMELVVTDEGKKLSGAPIKVYKNGSLMETVITDSKGLADISMDPNADYTLEIGGNRGLIKKKLSVNTKNVPPEAGKGDIYYPAEVEIFKSIDGLDLSILEKPIGKIFYDPEYGDFGADRAYTKQVQKDLERLKADFLAKKSADAANAKQKKKQYDAIIKVADKAFAAEDWLKAEEEYKKAKALADPLETYPDFQLAELKTKLIKLKANQKKYDEAIAKADAAVVSKDYEIAIAEYKRAGGYKPDESYPKEKIKEVQGVLANAAKTEQSYLAAIEKGDNALKINDLKLAKTAFEEALGYKSDEEYPKNKIAEINDVLAKKEAKAKEYDTAIKTADDALAAKDFETAKASYQKALTLKPTEAYPKDQIAKVDDLIAAEAKKEQDYLAAIEKGDKALAGNNFEEAKGAFEAASKLKPEEEYPKNKIKEIDDFIAKNAEKEKQYQDKIKEADKALAAKDYDNAKTAFEEAKTLKPTETYPQEKLTEIEGLIAQAAKLEEDYKAAIASGDNALEAKNFEEAKTAFNTALSLKPEEQYPKDKLGEIETIVLSNKKQEEEYNTAIQNGDDALANKDYDKAKAFFNTALTAKPDEKYPAEKITEIEGIVAAEAENEKNYTDALAAADAAFKSNEFEQAKKEYTKALSFKPEETYPQDQLTAIDDKLAANEKLEADYQAAIQEGDAALAATEFEKAKAAFEKAAGIKAEEQYPKDKIAEIDKLIAEQKSKEENYTKAIAKGDEALTAEKWEEAKSAFEEALSIKEDEYPKGKITEIETKLAELAAKKESEAKLEADYQAAIAEGDKYITDKKYPEAIAAFEKALGLKPEESYPQEKITEIKAEQDRLAAETAEKEKQEALQKQYDELIQKADVALAGKELEAAKMDYEAALALKVDENYPQSKIDEITGLLADAAALDKSYTDAIAAADALAGEEKLEEAKAKYAEASSLKAEEQYPKDKIAEIDKRLAEIAAEQEEIRLKNEKEEELNAAYQALITEADGLFTDQKFEEAKGKYTEALGLKAEEQYPKDKLTEIDAAIAALAEKEAADAAAAEQAKIEAAYQALIAEADGLFTDQKFEDAKAKYNEALGVKDDQYPKDKLSEIDAAIAALADKEAADAAAAEQAKVEAAYQALITEADGLFAEQKFEDAKAKYNEALGVKDDQYPKDKLSEIDAAIAALADKEAADAAAAEQAKKEAAYQALITEADALFTDEKFEEAKAKYNEALGVKDDQYPKDKIAEIDNAVITLANEKAAAEQAKVEAAYQALIAEADGLFTDQKFEEAKAKYNEALSVKEDQYPKDKITEVDAAIAALADKAAAEAAAAEQAKIDVNYNALVAKADELLAEKKFEEAKAKYNEALNVKDAAYPKDKIDEIEKSLAAIANKAAEAARQAKVDADYLIAIEAGDKALAENKPEDALQSFKEANSLKPSEEYPTNKIAEIEDLLAKADAEKEAEIKLINEKYASALSEAEAAFSAEEYATAISAYETAQNIKPSESFPAEKIKEIKELQAKLAADAEAIRIRKEEEAKNEAAYQTAILAADKLFKEEKLNEAENEYRLAQSLKPSETYPQAQLDKIQSIIDAKAAAELAAKRKKREAEERLKRYDELITLGDEAFQNKTYRIAKRNFEEALSIKPTESYPQSQLRKIEAIIEKERLAAQAKENEELDKPIEIMKGPKATINGDAEAEIERLYKEMWAKQNSDKNAVIKEKEEVVKRLNDENREKELARRQNAIQLIESISISVQEQTQMTSDLNLQNYERIKEVEIDLKDTRTELDREAERRRNNNAADQLALNENIRTFNKDREEQLVEGKKELVENEFDEIEKTKARRTANQFDRTKKVEEEYVQKSEEITAFNEQRADEIYEQNNARQIQLETDWESTLTEYNEFSAEKISKEKNRLEKDTEELIATNNHDNQMANARIDEQQQKVNDQQVTINQDLEANKESFKNNQLEVEEKEKALIAEQKELDEQAEVVRNENAKEEFYQGEKKIRQDRKSAEYPQGVTEEIIENQNNSTTIRRIVVDGTQTDIYEKTLYAWGGTFYTKNGNNISKDTWDKESR